MQDILKNLPEEKRTLRAWIGIIILLLYLLSFAIINILGSSLVQMDEKFLASQDPISLLVSQAFLHFLMFIVVGILISYLLLKFDVKEFFLRVSWISLGLSIGIALGSMVVISAIGEWNMNLEFGDSDFAKWARQSEDQLKLLTEHITTFQSVQHLFLALLAVAIIPAIGEELIFRGLIQSLFVRILKNHHAAIWLTGFIFAAIHLQFFGLAPRMLLGVVFGYMYYWSGKLSLAIIGHLINNGFALLLLYAAQNKVVDISPEQMDQSAPWPAVLFFSLITAYLLSRFYKKLQQNA
ncbi:MAG: CPBP family intramembrane glutamic endopeptidase [Bacteroidota bacterium]